MLFRSKDGAYAWAALHIKVRRVYDSPVLSASRIAEAVDPRLLEGYDVPVLGVSSIEDV